MAPQGLALALPFIKTLQDSGTFGVVVQPFIYQLEELPWKLLKAGANVDALKQVYLETNPLITAFAFALAISPIFLVVSEINRNYSQVDRCWSLLPTVFIAHYCTWAHMSGLPTTRLDNALAFSVLWSIRLTYNYWRRGGYQIGSEDYRWMIVKSKVHPVIFFLFNVTFISLIQSVLLFCITTPVYTMLVATSHLGNTMTWTDVIFARSLMALVIVEWFADQQQWDYHKAKAYFQKTAKVAEGYTRQDVEQGFCTKGLWAWSRHPNFAAEQAIWVSVYTWSTYVSENFWDWTCVGAVSYLALFQGSTWLTELITAGKYPEYAAYQERVGKFLPSFGGPSTPMPKAKEVKEAKEAKTRVEPPASVKVPPRTSSRAKRA